MDVEEVPQEYYYHLVKQGFMIEKRIGGGLSGGVYRATQGSLGRPVAVKFFREATGSEFQVVKMKGQRCQGQRPERWADDLPPRTGGCSLSDPMISKACQ